jgi:hypothetical protein
MKSFSKAQDRKEILSRLDRVGPQNQRRWGSMSAHQMICHLGDAFRAALGEKHLTSASTLYKRTLFKWAALWLPFRWPPGIKTRPEMDQLHGGTRPVDFHSDAEKLRVLMERFCSWKGEFAPHPVLGPLSRTERMRHAYLHMDHHLRQFGA